MAQTRKRRRRKHRGTQAGSVDRRGRGGRPRSRAEARARARSQLADRRFQRPTWRGAVNRGLIAAGIFLLLLVLVFQRPFGSSLALAAFMLAIYIPLGHYLDRLFYRIRMRREEREKLARREERDAR